jgi:hypothetical protein
MALRDASYQPRIVGAEPRADAWQPLVDATLPIDGDELLLLPEGEARGCVPTP